MRDYKVIFCRLTRRVYLPVVVTDVAEDCDNNCVYIIVTFPTQIMATRRHYSNYQVWGLNVPLCNCRYITAYKYSKCKLQSSQVSYNFTIIGINQIAIACTAESWF